MKLTLAEAEEYKRCAADPVYTLRHYAYRKDISDGKVKWEPYDWQVELLELLHSGANVIMLKSRQVGASWIIAFYVAWLIHFKPDFEVLLVSQKEEKAMKLLGKVRFICVNFPDFIRREFDADSKTRLSVIHRRVGNKVTSESTVDSLTTTSGSGRGDTAGLIFADELAHMQNGDEVYTAIKPATARGGQFVIASSPNGSENAFARVWMEADSGDSVTFTPMRIHYTDCGFDEEWLAKASDGMTDEQVMQEFELAFIGGGSPAFNPEHLKNCFIPMDQLMTDPEFADMHRLVLSSHKFASGVDTAEVKMGRGKQYRRDFNAIASFNEYGILVAAEANKKPLEEWAGNTVDMGDTRVEITGYVSQWHKQYPGWMYIEENGPGLTVANRHELPKDGISHMAMKRTTQKRKQRIVDQFRLAIAGSQVLITDKKTFYQLNMFQDLGGGKYSAPAGSHDDLVIAVLEAYDALLKMGGYEFAMPSVKNVDNYEVWSAIAGLAGQQVGPPIPGQEINSAWDYNLPRPEIDDAEWRAFLPTEENLARIREF